MPRASGAVDVMIIAAAVGAALPLLVGVWWASRHIPGWDTSRGYRDRAEASMVLTVQRLTAPADHRRGRDGEDLVTGDIPTWEVCPCKARRPIGARQWDKFFCMCRIRFWESSR